MPAPEDALLATLSKPEFWRHYVLDESDDFEADGVDAIELTLPASKGWRLLLHLDIDPRMHTLYLSSDTNSHELGHWDDARWHPFCLRWQELEAVVRWMRANPAECELSAETATLLLAAWVGTGADEDEQLEPRRRLIAAEFIKLGIFPHDEAGNVAAQLLAGAPEEDYIWRLDPDRGWTFGGEYPCYSNRNDSHDFPFPEFAQFSKQFTS